MKKILFSLLLLLIVQAALAQDVLPQSPGWFNRVGRPSLGFHGAANLWINDFDTRMLSGGGDVFMRYSFTRHFSLGVMASYDALQAKNSTVQPGHYALQNSYVEAKGLSADLVGWYHFSVGKTVAPYVYLGIGQFFYQRKVQGDLGWPTDDSQTSIHVPLGVGAEIALNKNLALSLELGARIMDKHTDNYVGGAKTILGTDWYPTGRAGLAFYVGTSDDDDSDGDGLTDGYEKSIGTAIDNVDTDHDGLSDYEEITKYKTNPTVADSDGDGLNDGDEVIKYHTSALDRDTDHDGLSDAEEVTTVHTDPLKADTDGDGLSDNEEVRTTKTDPLKTDTDGDGLSDAAELRTNKTNPLKADTDGGTVNDGTEVTRGTNPLDPNDDVPKAPTVQTVEVGKAIVLEGIVFKSGKALIEPQSEGTLQQALAVLSENAEIAVEIRGYTDNAGKAAANQKLSLRRAEAVKAWLVAKGIDGARIGVKGYGAENPIADNTTPEGKAKNRRIEFFRVK
jgi:outer membrane protein OmpA-like peptidoglycan-associated protein